MAGNFQYGGPYGNNPYSYPYYNPYQYQQQNQQNQQQPQMAQMAFVNGIEGAKAYQLAPNQSIVLMDSESPLAFMKQSNAMGQSTLRYFKLVETSEQDIRNSQNLPKTSTDDFVLRKDFDELSKKLDDLTKKIKKAEKVEKENQVNE